MKKIILTLIVLAVGVILERSRPSDVRVRIDRKR